MAPILTVIGATGTQGGSVIEAALKDGTYKVRGVTRNISSPAAKELSTRGVEMVSADFNDEESLIKAFQNSSAIFAVTDFFTPFATHTAEETLQIESTQGINLAKAASKIPTLEHYIWSTLPDNKKISNGKCSVPHFESKVIVDEFIRNHLKDLHEKTTYLWVSFYATNIVMPMFKPNFVATTAHHIQHLPIPPKTPITTLGSTSKNLGHYVLSILHQPRLTLPSKYVLAATETITSGDILKVWSKVTGKPALYLHVSPEQYDSMWPKWGREVSLMLEFWEVAGERSWYREEEEGGILTAEDLGVKDKLVGLESVFESLDWSEL